MSPPSIAVVIPIHNKGPHVRAAIASVLAQTRPADEIVLVDDASTDDSMAVAATFDDPRIRTFRREVPGPGGYAARNVGIYEAKSDWIAFLDADDAWYDNHLADVAGLIGKAGERTIGVFTGWERVWPDGRTRRDLYSASQAKGVTETTLDFDGFVARWLELGTPPIWTSSCVFRRDTLIAAGLFPEGRCRKGGDKDMWLRAMALGEALSTTSVSAAYHQDTVNQVTQAIGGPEPHCIWPTLEALSRNCPAPRKAMLAQLRNSDEFVDFRRAAAQERISPILHGGQRKASLRGLVLPVLAVLPSWPQQALRGLWRRLRARRIKGSSGA
jgi:succinoglycan biosynthesis protein ExoO